MFFQCYFLIIPNTSLGFIDQKEAKAMGDERKRKKIKIDRRREMRTKDISKMISEGGLGAEYYYDIEKISPEDEVHKD